jgi:hypothetical protein
MKRGSRIVLSAVFSILLLVGIGLIFVSRLDPTVMVYDSQQTVCNFQYDIQLNPQQTKSNDCVVLSQDWLSFLVLSNGNASMMIWLTKVGGGQVTLFNSTGDNLNATFPIDYDGALVADLSNVGVNSSEVNGSLSVETAIKSNTTALNTVYPYRAIGEGLVGVSAFAIFLIVWNPSLSVTTIPVRREP